MSVRRDTVTAPGILIGAPSSGSGKTTVSRGLMKLLIDRGLRVAPFKCGPDYIDTKYHTAVCGRPSVNLDLFMADAAHVRALYRHYSASCDVAVVEGMMGLYDGYMQQKGSSADVALTLGIPVVMVVDASSTGYSVGALLKGFACFNPRLEIAGVIFNRVGSARHERMMRDAAKDAGIRCIGCIPRCAEMVQASRYLGLDFDRSRVEEGIALAADIMAKNVDVDQLLSIMQALNMSDVPDLFPSVDKIDEDGVIAVACNNESFSFIYHEHIDLLRRLGKVVIFDPEVNRPIPDNTVLLYLPGGYPERHARELEAAVECRNSILRYVERGGKVLAECGGMMYLCRDMLPGDDYVNAAGGNTALMAGVLPFTVTNLNSGRRLKLGYRTVELDGMKIKGHEFHYTSLTDPHVLPQAAKVTDAVGNVTDSPLYVYKGVVASYIHLYWGTSDLPRRMLENN